MRRSNAFTLIELLVVVSIIGILFALLAPALSNAKKAGRNIACMSVMKQLGIGLSGYANDYGNWGLASYLQNSRPWPQMMSLRRSNNPDGLGYIQWDYFARDGMMKCPERTKPRTSSWFVDYSISAILGLSSRPWRVSPDNKLMKLDSIKSPSLLGWSGDANEYGGDGVWVVRHQKAVNVVFVDMHVEHWTRLTSLGTSGGELVVNLSLNWNLYPCSGNAP